MENSSNSVLKNKEVEVIFSVTETLCPWLIKKEKIRQIWEDYLLENEKSTQIKKIRYSLAILWLNQQSHRKFQFNHFTELSLPQRRQILFNKSINKLIKVNFAQKIMRKFFNSYKEHLRVLVTDILTVFYNQYPITEKEKETIYSLAQTLIPWPDNTQAVKQITEDYLLITCLSEADMLKCFHLAVAWLDAHCMN